MLWLAGAVERVTYGIDVDAVDAVDEYTVVALPVAVVLPRLPRNAKMSPTRDRVRVLAGGGRKFDD